MSSKINLEKFNKINELLKDEYVLLHINSDHKSLVIPEYLKKDNSVTLKISEFFQGHLEVNEELIISDLIFNNERVTCEIPIESVWGCTSSNSENHVWKEDMPKDVIRGIVSKILKKGEDPQKELKSERPVLKRVK